VRPATARSAGRPRNPELDRAILAAAEQQLREAGYAGMSLESVAAAAGTTVPAVRRRFRSKASVAVAVIDSLRVESMPAESGPPRSRALAVLRNFRANLLRANSMAVPGTLLAEEGHRRQFHLRARCAARADHEGLRDEPGQGAARLGVEWASRSTRAWRAPAATSTMPWPHWQRALRWCCSRTPRLGIRVPRDLALGPLLTVQRETQATSGGFATSTSRNCPA
jgi:AcrR family transcriptional regulator